MYSNVNCILIHTLYSNVTSELFSILENKLIGYADDSTLMAVVPSPAVRVAVVVVVVVVALGTD